MNAGGNDPYPYRSGIFQYADIEIDSQYTVGTRINHEDYHYWYGWTIVTHYGTLYGGSAYNKETTRLGMFGDTSFTAGWPYNGGLYHNVYLLNHGWFPNDSTSFGDFGYCVILGTRIYRIRDYHHDTSVGYVLAGAPPQTPRIDTSPSIGPATRFGLFLSSGIRYWYGAAADGQSYRADTAVNSERWYSYEAAASRVPYVTGTRRNRIIMLSGTVTTDGMGTPFMWVVIITRLVSMVCL